jgi:APA family basic amino acid/polyamine antiporter
MSAEVPGSDPRDRLPRTLSLHDAVFLVVSSTVGSGIFLTPGAIADRLPHPGLIFMVWGFGGLLALAGALANAELGAMFPRAGGDYVYLRQAFHPLAGFLVGWLSFFAIFAGTVAALGVGFASAAAPLLGVGEGAVVPLAVATVGAVSVLNYVSVRGGARANNVTGWIKVCALLAFGLVGPLTGAGSLENLRPLARGVTEIAAPAALALALSPVLFSYLGWNSSVYVASEISDPGRNVPRSLFLGLGICTAIYLVMNAVYLYALPVGELRGTANAGEAAARVLFGELGGRLVNGFVLVSILGTLNATVLVGPRIAYAMALDGLFVPGVDRVHTTFKTPGWAVAAQALVAAGLLLLLRTFPSALDFTTFAILLATMADVAALYRLRHKVPEQPRPYRAWGYPWVPGLYLLANAGIALGLLIGRPAEALTALAVLLAGLPFYVLWRRVGRPVPHA